MTDDLKLNADAVSSVDVEKTTRTPNTSKANGLSAEETREILTPFAFKVDQSLFGISLAVPWRRGMALIIDLLLVAMLSGAPGELLAVLVAITLFKVASNKYTAKFGRKPGFRQAFLRFTAVFIVFVVLVETLPTFFSEMDKFNNNVEQAGQAQSQVSSKKNSVNNEDVDNNFAKAALTLAASVAVSQSDCDSYNCWQTLTTDLFIAYAEQSPTAKQIEAFKQSLIANVTEESALNKQQVEQLNAQLQKSLAKYSAKHLAKKNETNEQKIDAPGISNVISDDDWAQERVLNEGKNKTEDSSNAAVYKGFAWLQGLIEDLGIGFGWAAFYFTMFTALWHGQTPGKKLFHIRVIQLDGTPLSIWDSFGRYGGYGAGIATGLLGFAQIYWDPNRQAIHDKISATIVVNDNDSNRASGYS